jgi:hypothetical protein
MTDKLITVYKKNGTSLKVNEDMLPHLDKLGLSKSKPKAAAKPKAKS